MMLRMLGWFETFSYDPAGNRTGMDQFTPPTQNVNAAYSYDQANQLLVEATGSSGGATGPGYVSTYAYDGSGNWTTRLDEIAFVSPFSRQYTTTYAHDNAGELTGNSAAWTGYPTGGSGASAATYTYDAAGNRLTANVGGVVTTYSWDYENRLIGATFSPLATLTSGILTNLYSSDGLRQGYADHTGITTLTYDILSQNIYRRDVLSTAATERYTNRPEAYGSPISVCRVATATGAIVTNLFYNSVDGTANINSLAAAGDSTTANAYILYPAFGAGSANVPTIPSPLSTQPFQYMGAVGYYTDPSTGLIYVKARWYDPLTGIWLSEDPIGFDGRDWSSLYRYVKNRPVRMIDPSGLAHVNPGFFSKMLSCIECKFKKLDLTDYTVGGQSPPDASDSIPMAACKLITSNLTSWCKDNPLEFAEKFGIKLEFHDVEIPPSVDIGPLKVELSLGICDCMVDTICQMQLSVTSIFSACRGGCLNDPDNPAGCCNTCCENIANNFGSYSAGFQLCYGGCSGLPGPG
jgi:RHS repeat-associated protein